MHCWVLLFLETHLQQQNCVRLELYSSAKRTYLNGLVRGLFHFLVDSQGVGGRLAARTIRTLTHLLRVPEVVLRRPSVWQPGPLAQKLVPLS